MYTGWENLRERNYLEEPRVVGRMILSWIFRKWDGCRDWIVLARDKDW
jgi:hypothetical protein